MTKASTPPPKPSQKRTQYAWPSRILLHQLRSATQSIGHLCRTPWSSIMIILVIGMTLAMPLGLSITLKTIQALSPDWQQQTPISLYLKVGTSDQDAQQLRTALARSSQLSDARYITPAQGLAQLRQQAGYGDILDALDENPLPGVIVLTPRADLKADDINKLVHTLQQQSTVNQVKLDMDWIKRLHALLTLGQQVVWLLAASLGIGVLLIIGNVIALNLQKYQQDMTIYQWLGATDHFIRQPFLYMGTWMGALGGATAWGLIYAASYLLQPAMHQLSVQYGIWLDGHTLPYMQGVQSIAIGAILGMLGARFAVNRYLQSSQQA